MKRNTMLAMVGLFLMILVGVGAAYWGVKKYRQRQNREYRCEAMMGSPKEGFDQELFRKVVLEDKVLEEVIEKHQLVGKWGLADVDAAKERIKKKFIVRNDGKQVKVSYQDHDKTIAEAVLKSIVASYNQKVKRYYGVPEAGAKPAPASKP